jgi:hypothetical protein
MARIADPGLGEPDLGEPEAGEGDDVDSIGTGGLSTAQPDSKHNANSA